MTPADQVQADDAAELRNRLRALSLKWRRLARPGRVDCADELDELLGDPRDE